MTDKQVEKNTLEIGLIKGEILVINKNIDKGFNGVQKSVDKLTKTLEDGYVTRQEIQPIVDQLKEYKKWVDRGQIIIFGFMMSGLIWAAIAASS